MKIMTRDEVLEYENGLFKPTFQMFENIVNDVNHAMSSLERNIEFSVANSYEFNAHARKEEDGNTYTIILRSGIIPMTFQVIGENIDFFTKHYPELEDKETSLALGSVFVWTQIFAHELGHIIRGHTDILKNKSTNLVEDSAQISMVEMPSESELETDQVKMLMEFDADIFSSYFVAQVILNTIKNAKKEIDVEDKTIVSLALTAMFFLFNYLCELEGKSTKYPPAMVRANAIHMHLIKHLSGKTSLSDEDLSKVMRKSIFDAYSFLVDEHSFQQGMGQSDLDHLYNVETDLLSKYPVFTDLISKCVLLDFLEN
ncbi:TPA: hypothetical protein ACN311_001890 [Vibrio parahaemolyticus]